MSAHTASAVIETPLGPVTVTYLPGRLVLGERRQDLPGDGDWLCEMTLPHPGKQAAPYRVQWRQSEATGYLYYQQAAKQDGVGGFTALYGRSPWRATLARIEAECVPAVQSWAATDSAAFARTSAIAQALRNKRRHAESKIVVAQQDINRARSDIAHIDAWLTDLAPPFPGDTP